MRYRISDKKTLGEIKSAKQGKEEGKISEEEMDKKVVKALREMIERKPFMDKDKAG
jgi:hypothetical protein